MTGIEFIILTSLICTGVFICTWDGMILAPFTIFYDRLKYKLKKEGKHEAVLIMNFLRNPLFGCMYCMSSVWTFVSWLVFGSFSLIQLPFYMLAVCGCNSTVFAIIRFTVPGYGEEEDEEDDLDKSPI